MGFWDDDYDFANGAPFGDFDLDNDGDIDIIEGAHKLAHYGELWDEEDRASGIGDDEDEISPLGSSNISDLDLDLGLYEPNDLEDLAEIYNVPVEYLKARGIELGYFWEEDFEEQEDYDEEYDEEYDEDYKEDYENYNTLEQSDDDSNNLDALDFLVYNDIFHNDEDNQDERNDMYEECENLELLCVWAWEYLDYEDWSTKRTVTYDFDFKDNDDIFYNTDKKEYSEECYDFLMELKEEENQELYDIYRELLVLALDDFDDPDDYLKIYSMLMAVGLLNANEEEVERARFIVKNWDTCLAARYLNPSYTFLFSKAINDHFTLPVALPVIRSMKEEFTLDEIIKRIARRDLKKAIEIWMWLIENFSSYTRYSYFIMNENDFSYDISKVIVVAYGEKFYDFLIENPKIMEEIITKNVGNLYKFNKFTDYLIRNKKYDILENAVTAFNENKYFLHKYINTIQESIFNAFDNTIVTGVYDKKKIIQNWQYYIAKIYPQFKKSKYVYVKEDADYYLEKAQEKIQELQDVTKIHQEELKRLYLEEEAEEEAAEKIVEDDSEEFIYVGVIYSKDSDRVYNYRTNNENLKIGDTVTVKAGQNNQLKTVTIVSVGRYTRIAAPFPPEKSKFIED